MLFADYVIAVLHLSYIVLVIVKKQDSLGNREKTGKHKSRAPTNNKILNVTVIHARSDHDYKLKAAELQLAIAIACHCPIKAVDHLGEITKLHSGKDSVFSNLRLHRTKCTALVKNVLSPFPKEDLITDRKNQKFSIIVDESTDISTRKHCVSRFFFHQIV